MAIFYKYMSKIIEVIDSLNNENVDEVKTQLASEADALNKTNSQLYKRAKKAEGFTYNKDTKGWEKKEKKVEPTKTENGLDYGQKAFLVANGIKGAEETALVEEFIAESGKELDDAINSQYLQAKLKGLRTAQKNDLATPKGSKRSNTTVRDTTEYWIKKGELPPANNPELRRKVVNAKLKKQTSGNKFTETPVA